jgi:hypothetical protein
MHRFGLNKQATSSDFFDSTIFAAKREKGGESLLDAGMLLFLFFKLGAASRTRSSIRAAKNPASKRRPDEKLLGCDMSLMTQATGCLRREERHIGL